MIGSWQHVLLCQRIFDTAHGDERSRGLSVVSREPTVVLCRTSYRACRYLEFWGEVLLGSRDSPVFQQAGLRKYCQYFLCTVCGYGLNGLVLRPFSCSKK